LHFQLAQPGELGGSIIQFGSGRAAIGGDAKGLSVFHARLLAGGKVGFMQGLAPPPVRAQRLSGPWRRRRASNEGLRMSMRSA